MIDQLDELYREVILDHYKSPARKGGLAGAQVNAQGANPLCGDELTFHIRLDGGRLAQVRFQGAGCAISQAAASMLADRLEGASVEEAGRVIDAMKRVMQGGEPDGAVELGDLEALAGVRKFPVRVKCAALSWNVVEQGLKEHANGGH